MKTVLRILMILLAGTVVIAAAWALTRNGADAQSAPRGEQFRAGGDFNGERFAAGQRPEGFPGGGFERGRERGGFFLFGWTRNIVLVAAIVTVIVQLERWFDKRRMGRENKIPIEGKQTE